MNEDNWLFKQRVIFEQKESIRVFYGEMFQLLRSEILKCTSTSKIVEIGTGGGLSTYFLSDLNYVKSDAVKTRFADEVVDAQNFPYDDESLDVIFGVDVFHHIPKPFDFLKEAERCLKPGGKILLIEPAITPFSWPVYKFLHPEPMKWSIKISKDSRYSGDDVMDANNALPSKVFPNNSEGNLLSYEIDLRYTSSLFGFISMLSAGGINSPISIPLLNRKVKKLFDWEMRRSSKFRSLFSLRTLIVVSKA